MHSKQGRGNNLVSDIQLNAYISSNVCWMKTWSRRSSSRRYHYTCCATRAIPGWSQNHHLHYFTHHLKHSDIHWFCSRGFLLWVLCGVKTIIRNAVVARMIWPFYSIQQTHKAKIMQLLFVKTAGISILFEGWIKWLCNVKMLTYVSKPRRLMTSLFFCVCVYVSVSSLCETGDLSRVYLVFTQCQQGWAPAPLQPCVGIKRIDGMIDQIYLLPIRNKSYLMALRTSTVW